MFVVGLLLGVVVTLLGLSAAVWWEGRLEDARLSERRRREEERRFVEETARAAVEKHQRTFHFRD